MIGFPGIPADLAPALATAERALGSSTPSPQAALPQDAVAAEWELDNAEALSPAQRLEHTWRRYLDTAADVPETLDLVATTIRTVVTSPVVYCTAFWDEFTAVLGENWDQLVESDRRLKMWIGQFFLCEAVLTARWYYGHPQDFTGPCAFIGDTIDTMRLVGRAAETIDELADSVSDAIAEDPAVVLELAATFLEIEILLIDALSDDRGAYAWLREYAADPQRLGQITGAIWGIVFFEVATDIATGALGRFAKVAGLLEVSRAGSGVPTPMLGRSIRAARPRRVSAFRSGLFSPGLDKLVAAFQDALSKGGKRLSGRITNQRLRLLLKNLSYTRADYARMLAQWGKHVGQAFGALHYTKGSYSSLSTTCGKFNPAANVAGWLDILSQKPGLTVLDDATAVAETAAQATKTLEAAHGIDRRLLEIPHFAALARQHLGWANADAATAIALTPAEHTRSFTAFLRRYGGLTEADLPDANEPSVKRLTSIFEEQIKWVAKPVGHPPKGQVWLTPQSTLTDLIEAHKTIWKEQFPLIWKHWKPDFDKWSKAATGH